MAFQMVVDSNIKQILREMHLGMPQAVQFAAASALNKGMTKAQGVAVRAAAKARKVAQKHIRAKQRRQKATRNHLVAAVDFNARGLNPLTLGMSPSKALTYYTGQRISEPFVMRMPNGSEQIVVRLPKSRNPSPARTSTGARRKGRLPVASIRIFIGRETIDRFIRAMNNEGTEAFENEFFRLVERAWAKGS